MSEITLIMVLCIIVAVVGLILVLTTHSEKQKIGDLYATTFFGKTDRINQLPLDERYEKLCKMIDLKYTDDHLEDIIKELKFYGLQYIDGAYHTELKDNDTITIGIISDKIGCTIIVSDDINGRELADKIKESMHAKNNYICEYPIEKLLYELHCDNENIIKEVTYNNKSCSCLVCDKIESCEEFKNKYVCRNCGQSGKHTIIKGKDSIYIQCECGQYTFKE